jgi:hypothetical protein
MNKKWLILGSAIGISSIVMVSTGFSALASTSGYDAYKSALKNMKTVQNVAVQAAATLQDNGNVKAQASGTFKVSMDKKSASGSADVSANGTNQSLSFFKQNNQTVLKSSASDIYYVSQNGKENKKAKQTTETEFPQQVETVIDALVGNLKDYVVVNDNSDGSKKISIQLDNAQIPTVVNALAPIAIKEATKVENDGEQKDAASTDLPFQENILKSAAPQLTQDIKIEKVALTATINASNYIEHQVADVTVSGKDSNGAVHQITLHLQADLSGYNATTPDIIDLTGKNVQQIKHDQHGKHE